MISGSKRALKNPQIKQWIHEIESSTEFIIIF